KSDAGPENSRAWRGGLPVPGRRRSAGLSLPAAQPHAGRACTRCCSSGGGRAQRRVDHGGGGRRAPARSVRRGGAGPATRAAGRGANALLKDGAKLVQYWTDILAELSEPWRSRIAAAGSSVVTTALPSAESDEGRMLEALSVDEAQHIERLIARTEIDAARA